MVLRELSPVADAATRTYEAHFTLPADVEATLGMSATVRIAPAAGQGAEFTPSRARSAIARGVENSKE